MKKSFYLLMMMTSVLAAVSCGSKQEASKHGVDRTYLDTTVSPKTDFYAYSTGGWQKANPLKPEFSRFGSFDMIAEATRENLNVLFADMAKMDAEFGTIDQKISDLYKMGLDSVTRNEAGAEPMLADVAVIQSISSKEDLATKLGEMSLYGEGGFYGVGVEADLTDSKHQILYMSQGGLGMGDRDYYLKPENAALKAGYKAFLEKIFTLTGLDNPARRAANALAVEDAIAQYSWSREELRNIPAMYNPYSTEEILAAWPNLNLRLFFEAAQIPAQEKVIVAQPTYFDALDKYMAKADLEQIKDYLLGQYISGCTGALSDDFYTASWEFFSHQMSGATEQQPRWKRAMAAPNGILSEAVGQMYVERYFPESSKQQMLELVNNLKDAFSQHIDGLDWMSDETKARAHEKLDNFIVKIGYPDKWKDYSTLTIDPKKSYYENMKAASAWYVADNRDKLGKETDVTEWGMPPQMVNAYYNPTTNEICFPAAILQPPFFDPNADDAINYGGIGVVIGHEMSHGFDDQGSQFDKDGNMVNWWTEEDRAKFDAKGEQLAAQFDVVEILPGLMANGKVTLGENIGDHGGLSIAYTAMENAMKKHPENNVDIDGFTPAQRFYLSYGAIWAQNITDQEKARLTNLDVHSLAENRVNVSLRNFQTFFDAFGIQEGDPMFRPESERVHIW